MGRHQIHSLWACEWSPCFFFKKYYYVMYVALYALMTIDEVSMWISPHSWLAVALEKDGRHQNQKLILRPFLITILNRFLKIRICF